jgi:hypothetical protein
MSVVYGFEVKNSSAIIGCKGKKKTANSSNRWLFFVLLHKISGTVATAVAAVWHTNHSETFVYNASISAHIQ